MHYFDKKLPTNILNKIKSLFLRKYVDKIKFLLSGFLKKNKYYFLVIKPFQVFKKK